MTPDQIKAEIKKMPEAEKAKAERLGIPLEDWAKCCTRPTKGQAKPWGRWND